MELKILVRVQSGVLFRGRKIMSRYFIFTQQFVIEEQNAFAYVEFGMTTLNNKYLSRNGIFEHTKLEYKKRGVTIAFREVTQEDYETYWSEQC